MPTINVNRQGTATGAVSSNFNTARTSAAGSVNDGDTSSSIHVQYFHSASRGGLTKRFKRVFLHFDTSGITGTLSAAHVDVRGTSSSDPNDTIMIKSTAFGGDGGTALAAGDIDAIVGWTTGASAEGNVTKYSSPALGAGLSTTWSTSGYNDLASTSDLRSDMKNNNVVIVCFMDYTNDFRNTALTSNVSLSTGLWWTDYSGTSNDPHIEYTIAAGYANNVNGVAAASISKINGVATASIEKVNGI